MLPRLGDGIRDLRAVKCLLYKMHKKSNENSTFTTIDFFQKYIELLLIIMYNKFV